MAVHVKPWEETWSTHGSDEVANERGTIASFGSEAGDYERTLLASAAPDMARVLIAIEWGATDEGDNDVCPSCGFGAFVRPDPKLPKVRAGHRPDCALDAALRKAGVRS